MRELTLDEVKAVGFAILKDVTDFCEANGIDYFLTAGTLLGSVRHEGFVPWDDDTDITMPRNDYERFLATYRPKGRFRLLSCRADHRYWVPHACVAARDTMTPRSPEESFGRGVVLDVFPLDSFRSTGQLRRIMKMAWVLKRFTKGRCFGTVRKCWRCGSWKTLAVHPLVNPWTVNLASRIIDWMARINQKRAYEIMAVVGAPGCRVDESYRRSDLFPTRREGRFEGHLFRIPNRPEVLLRGIYGDYMQLPPPEKQKPQHFREAYWREN